MRKIPLKKLLLYGKNSIRERLKIKPRSIRRIFIQESFTDRDLLERIKNAGIPCQTMSQKEMQNTRRADRLQGIIAEINPFACLSLDEFLQYAQKNPRTLLMLDGLNDPHNMGSIIRSVACFGGFAICIPRHRSCEVNETVLHVASGGENYVPVVRVSNLGNALRKLKKNGYWVAGTDVKTGKSITDTSFPFPLCFIFGSEGKGMSPGLKKLLDLTVTIPMSGAALSFNVAMAAAICSYEITRQRPPV